jgi:hypothetical protein
VSRGVPAALAAALPRLRAGRGGNTSKVRTASATWPTGENGWRRSLRPGPAAPAVRVRRRC